MFSSRESLSCSVQILEHLRSESGMPKCSNTLITSQKRRPNPPNPTLGDGGRVELVVRCTDFLFIPCLSRFYRLMLKYLVSPSQASTHSS